MLKASELRCCPMDSTDYIKVDGCGDPAYYPAGYAAMGAALESSGRDIAYSCSWPAYIGGEVLVAGGGIT